MSLAAARSATVRLLGDFRQLSAVESGGALRLVAAEPGTPELTVLHRFQNPEEAAETLKIRSGKGSAVDWYYAHDRIRGGSRDAMTRAAYESWRADMLAGKTTLMAAGDGADVARLSARARADRVLAGQVEAEGVALHDGNLAGRGDWIVTRRNNRRLSAHSGQDWVKNGDTWTVERRHDDGSLSVRHMTHGGRITLPAAYVRAHVQLMYATTAHRAQGSTVDTAHPLITPSMTRETLYVLATRAREKTTLYVATHDLPAENDDARTDQVRSDPSAYEAREILMNIVTTEGAALSATETIAAAQDHSESLAALVPRYLHAVRQDAGTSYRVAAPSASPGRPPVVTGDPVLPWVPAPPPQTRSGGMPAYLGETAALIEARVRALTDQAVCERPTWMTALGTMPENAGARAEWLRHVAIIAAYRDQYQIAPDDPGSLGPRPAPGDAGCHAHWHAAGSVLTARSLSGLDQPPPNLPPAPARRARPTQSLSAPAPNPPVMLPPQAPWPSPPGPVPRL